MSYGHALKTLGRRAWRLPPIGAASRWSRASARYGGVWPTSRPSASATMIWRRCARSWRAPSLDEDDRFHLEFAHRQGAGGCGRLRADHSEHYAQGNAICGARSCTTVPTKPARACADMRERYSRANFSLPASAGVASRARSDLHRRPAALGLDPDRADPVQPPPVEGTMELPEIPRSRATCAAASASSGGMPYPEALAALDGG